MTFSIFNFKKLLSLHKIHVLVNLIYFSNVFIWIYFSFGEYEINLLDVKIFIVGIFQLIFLIGFVLELKEFITTGKILKWNINEFLSSNTAKIKKELIYQYIALDIAILLLLAVIQYFLPVDSFYFLLFTFLTIIINYGLIRLKRTFEPHKFNSMNSHDKKYLNEKEICYYCKSKANLQLITLLPQNDLGLNFVCAECIETYNSLKSFNFIYIFLLPIIINLSLFIIFIFNSNISGIIGLLLLYSIILGYAGLIVYQVHRYKKLSVDGKFTYFSKKIPNIRKFSIYGLISGDLILLLPILGPLILGLSYLLFAYFSPNNAFPLKKFEIRNFY